MRKVSILILSVVMIITSCTESKKEEYVSKDPHRIMLTIPGDPATSRAVTWRTNTESKLSVGQIAEASDTPFFEDRIQNFEGTSNFWEKGNESALGHQVIFSGLKPDTEYLYRVGDGATWSEWFQFKTANDSVEDFNFLYLGDFQNDIKQFCSRAIRQAYSHFPNAEFMLFAGDLAGEKGETYWDEFFNAGDWIYGMMPSVPTPGNNEYYTDEEGNRVFSKEYNQIFVNPVNGPEGLHNKTFYIDYQGVRFVSVDSPAMGYDKEDNNNTIQWLHDVLENNPCEWTIVFTHYPVYSCSQGRKEKDRVAIKYIVEKYGVDLVLQGHDHTYCRGQFLDNIGEDCANPPMYMVSVSGPKMYGLSVDKWSDRVASEVQLYQNVSVTKDMIKVQTYTVLGELYDEFAILKDPKGGFNEILESEEINKINERVNIPKKAKGKYSDEDMLLYKDRF